LRAKFSDRLEVIEAKEKQLADVEQRAASILEKAENQAKETLTAAEAVLASAMASQAATQEAMERMRSKLKG
ncbi:MAG: hypothetical protein HKN74_11015, partial [Acidimicrobiia bacterium]|nr:hypothetical protein [Acidimicrobiia bacterium]